jgi:hypothetical protein
MSDYLMTVGELAKSRGEPVAEFIKKINALGFEAGSHAKKLTQGDLDKIILLLDPNKPKEKVEQVVKVEAKVVNPNVLMVNLPSGKRSVMFVDATVNESGEVAIRVVSKSTEDSLGEALLEFRKQLGLKLGVN